MNELTPTQEQSLVSYSEKRDNVLAEVKTLTQERDTLASYNKELSSTNASLVAEIVSNGEALTELKQELALFKKGKQKEYDSVNEELKSINSEKSRADAELLKSTELLAKLNNYLKQTAETAESINQFMSSTKKDVYDNANVIANSAANVSRVVMEMNNIVEEFYNVNTSKAEANVKKEQELNTFKAQLDNRERALNLAYNEVIVQMKKDGKDLSELNLAA